VYNDCKRGGREKGREEERKRREREREGGREEEREVEGDERFYTWPPVVIFLNVIASAALPPSVMHILSNSCQ
jgi:hypothetical protein